MHKDVLVRIEIRSRLNEGCFSPFSPLRPPNATEVAGRNGSVRCRASRMFCDLLKLHRGDFVMCTFAGEHQLSGISNPKIEAFKMSRAKLDCGMSFRI